MSAKTKEELIDDWGKWIVRAITSGTCIFLVQWGLSTTKKLDAVINIQSAQVERNIRFDEKNATQDTNIYTLFTSRDILQQQVLDLYRYHPKKD